MSNPLQTNGKFWIYCGSTLILGAIVFTLLNLGKSSQSQSAGNGKVENSGVPSRSTESTTVNSSDGKITELNPQNEKETIEVGKITKVSDIATLPEGAKVQSIPFDIQETRARQGEAKTYVGSMNRSQQMYYVMKTRYASSIEELALGIPSETENYRYKTQIIDSIKTLDTKNYPGIAIQTGIAKKEGLKSFLGIVYLSRYSSNDLTSMRDPSLAILCTSNEPIAKESGLPKFNGKEMQCPDGYKNLAKLP